MKEVTLVVGFEGWMEIGQAESVGVAFPARGVTVSSATGKTQSTSRQVPQSWMKTAFCREGRGRGAKAGKTVWDLIGWGLECQAEAGSNGNPLTFQSGVSLRKISHGDNWMGMVTQVSKPLQSWGDRRG